MKKSSKTIKEAKKHLVLEDLGNAFARYNADVSLTRRVGVDCTVESFCDLIEVLIGYDMTQTALDVIQQEREIVSKINNK